MKLTESQQRLVDHDKGDMIVSASAGSGKTHTMVARLIRLIAENKTAVSGLLAVTFTEKAAAEVKERLYKALTALIRDGRSDLKSSLDEIATADVCTLHAFCNKLLRQYFYAAGLTSDYAVLDEADANELRMRAVDDLFDELYEQNDRNFAMLVERYAVGRSDRALKELIFGIYEYTQTKADPVRALRACIEPYTAEGFKSCSGAYNDFLQRRRALLEARIELLAQRAETAGLEKYAAHLRALPQGTEGKLPVVHLKDDVQRQIRETLDRQKKHYKALREECEGAADEKKGEAAQLSCGEHVKALAETAEKFAARYAEEKREVNALDFNDLEHYALKLLENADIREDVAAHYAYICVDEYQDINDVQNAILERIADDNMLMVGDVKQCIYGFRGSDPDLFVEREKELGGRGAVMFLNENFRSARKVVEGVNAVFDQAMYAAFSQVDYKNNARLVGSLPLEGRFSLDVFRYSQKREKASEPPGVYDVLTAKERQSVGHAGDFLVSLIKKEMESTLCEIDGQGAVRERKIQYGDIAVLVRSRNEYSDGLLQALAAAGIPVTAESKNSIVEYAEIRMLTDILKFIDNGEQDEPLVAAMKALWLFTDDELAEIRLRAIENGRRGIAFFTACAIYPENGRLGEKLAAFKAYMRKVRLLAGVMGAAELLERVMRECALDVRIAASPTGRQKMRRVRRFIAAAEGREIDVRRFLERIGNAQNGITLAESAADNAVKMLTIHSSKGLEFPVVFVVGTERRFNFRDSFADLIIDRKEGFAVRAYDDDKRTRADTLQYKYLKKRMTDDMVREELRLFYVALTRAKYSLHVVAYDAEPSFDVEFAGRYADFLPDDLERTYYDESFIDSAEKKRNTLNIAVGEPDRRLAEKIKENFAFVYPYARETATPLKTSVTESLRRDAEEGEVIHIARDFLDEETTAESGTAMHRYLELCDFAAPDAAAEAKRLEAAGLLLPQQCALLDIPVLQKLIDSGTFASLAGKIYREKKFQVNCPAETVLGETCGGEVLLQGVIDLLAIDGDKAVIYDYKYSHKSAEALKAAYKKQLSLYKYAVESGLDKKVEKAYIVSLVRAELIDAEV